MSQETESILSQSYSDLKDKHVELQKDARYLSEKVKELKSKLADSEKENKELRGLIKEGFVSPKTHRKAISRYQQLERFYQQAMAELLTLRKAQPIEPELKL